MLQSLLSCLLGLQEGRLSGLSLYLYCICINDAASFISLQVECVTEPIVMPTGAVERQTVWAVFVFVLYLY